MTEYVSKTDVLNLPQSIERNLCGEIVERSIDVKDIESLEPADVVPVVRCKDCLFFTTEKSCCRPEGLIKAREDAFCSYGERKE